MAIKKPIVLTATGDLQQIQSGDYIDIPAGGTGATTAAAARTNLGLAIGTNVQAWSSELDAVAALASTGLTVRTGVGTRASRSLTAPVAGLTISNNDGVSGNPTFALANDLGAIEALNTNGILVRTATDTWAARTLTVASTGRLTISNGDGIGGNPTLDLATTGVAANTYTKVTVDTYGRVTAASNPTTLAGYAITDAMPLSGGTFIGTVTLAADPVNPLEPATKQYVDNNRAGLDAKDSVKCVATSNITLSGLQTIDGYSVQVGDRVLVTGQTTQSANGIYLAGTGAWTRTTDFNSAATITPGAFTFVEQGTAYANSGFVLQTTGGTVAVGTTSLTFAQFSGAGEIINGNGIGKSGNTLSVNATARFTFTGNALDLADSGVGASGGTYTKLTVDRYGRVTGGATATAADVGAQAASTELSGLAGLSANGFPVRTAAGTYTSRSLTAPAAGLTITNPDGVNGSPTFTLANDLAALEGLTGAGIAVRTGTDAWVNRTLSTASVSRITVANGDGVAGNPTIDLATVVTAGTYSSVTVDAYGRVTGGTATGTTPTQSVGISMSNGEAASISIGQPVYVSAAGQVKKAVANATGTKDVMGLVFDTTIASAAAGNMVSDGILTATSTQWDAVTGQTGGLTAGAIYYLSNVTAGGLTTTAPSTGFICRIGLALSATQMQLRIGTPVQL